MTYAMSDLHGEYEKYLAMLQTMQEAVKGREQEPLSMDDVTDMLAGQIGQVAPMDEEATDLFRQLMKNVMEQTVKETD